MSSENENSTPAAPAVPLSSHQHRDSATLKNKPPVWALENSIAPSVSQPLTTKCARHETSRSGVCCKELKGDDERRLVDPDVVRDVVIGLSDGLTVPFALTAGLSSLGESKLVVLGGIAELIAGALSMGIGGFLASQAERDHYRYLRRVRPPVCFGRATARWSVTRSLMEAELSGNDVGSHQHASSSVASVSDEEEAGLRWSQDVGITPFLLKFGEGLEEVPTKRLYVSAFTVGMGYLVGGFIPLFPYFFISRAKVALLFSCLFTGIVLLIFGAIKARITGAGNGVGGYIWGAVSTLLVGGAAAAAAYGIVALLED
ncbi:hypothetical protein EW146_g8086 [Bondarzewia mesenterica]|uniref:DUF125-domain-containing protein n=1 Tax=Bondarzewia mesenterica TaxID=1095465 RepID=A0A4S4LJ15_9AGAM|nr:hypothetical protein EW146_g8086 [Bondarzewia mesenterica]